jgi:four helix bundle protein
MHFDKLDVYRTAIEYVQATRPLVVRLRRRDLVIADQLQRAVLSVACNVAEGAGEFSPGDKARLYRYALRSATESVALVDASKAIGAAVVEEHHELRDTGLRLVAMLTRLVVTAAGRVPVTRQRPRGTAPDRDPARDREREREREIER